MNKVISDLCALRAYRSAESTPGLYLAPDGAHVFFYFTETLTQEFLTLLLPMIETCNLIILYEKQKKLKFPLEMLPRVETHNLQTLRRQLIPNQFCPRFERLEGEERKQLECHMEQLPILLTTDPMAQIYGFRAGDIVKIYRLDGSLYFRRLLAAN